MAGWYLWAWVATRSALVVEQGGARRDGDEAGQNGLEYALVAGVVVVAIIAAFSAFPIGTIISSALTKVQNLLT